MHPTYMGMKIVINDCLDEYESVPKCYHKRKRIQKKWSKRFGFVSRFVKSNALVCKNDNMIIMSTRSYEAIRRQLTTYTVDKEKPSTQTFTSPPRMDDYPSNNLQFLTTNYFPSISRLFNPISA